MCRLEHLVRLPDTRNVPEEDFQFAPVLLPLLTLHAGEEEIGIGTTFRSDDHGTQSPHTHQYEHHIDNLYADKRGDDPANTIDDDIIPQGDLSGHRAIGHATERKRDEGNDDQCIEDHG